MQTWPGSRAELSVSLVLAVTAFQPCCEPAWPCWRGSQCCTRGRAELGLMLPGLWAMRAQPGPAAAFPPGQPGTVLRWKKEESFPGLFTLKCMFTEACSTSSVVQACQFPKTNHQLVFALSISSRKMSSPWVPSSLLTKYGKHVQNQHRLTLGPAQVL